MNQATNVATRSLSPNARAALAIAIAADVIQLPVNLVMLTGVLAIPAEFLDLMIDGAVFIATTRLLGFHPLLLPTAVIELVPGMDTIPTWTGCVAYLAWSRKQDLVAAEQRAAPARQVTAHVEVLPELPEVCRDE